MKEFNGNKFYTGFEVNNILKTPNLNLFFKGLNQYHYFNGLIGVQLLTKNQAKERINENLKDCFCLNKDNSLTSFLFLHVTETINVNGFLINSSLCFQAYREGKLFVFESVCFKQSDYVEINITGKAAVGKELLLYPTSSTELVNCIDTVKPIKILSDRKIVVFDENLHEHHELGQQVSIDWFDFDKLAEKLAESLIDEVTNHDKAILTPYYLESEIKEKAKEFGIKYDFENHHTNKEQPQKIDEGKNTTLVNKTNFRGERNLKLALYAMANLLAEENEDKYKHKSSENINVAEIAKHISSYLEKNKDDFFSPPRMKSGYFATEYSKIKKELSNYIEQALNEIEEEI